MFRFLLVVAVILAADQLSKYLIRANFALGESMPIIDNFFHLTYIENPGAALAFWLIKPYFLLF